MARELENVLKYLVTGAGRERRGAYVVLGLILTAGILALDTLTPYELNFAFLYPLPILLVTIAAGQGSGLVLSVVCAVFVIVSDIYGGKEYSQRTYMLFDVLAYACFYALFTLLTGALCSALRREVLFSREDELTGIANRKRLEEHAQEEMERCRQNAAPFSLVLVDCRDFRLVNDAFGRDAGDKVLNVVARTLQDAAHRADMVGRLEGDKFAVVLHDQNPAAAKASALAMETALLTAMRSMKLELGFCIGAMCCTHLAAEYEQMLAEATSAMHKAYAAGGGVVFVNSEC